MFARVSRRVRAKSVDRVVHLDTESLAEYELEINCEIGALTYDGFVVLGVDMVHLAPDQTGVE